MPIVTKRNRHCVYGCAKHIFDKTANVKPYDNQAYRPQNNFEQTVKCQRRISYDFFDVFFNKHPNFAACLVLLFFV